MKNKLGFDGFNVYLSYIYVCVFFIVYIQCHFIEIMVPQKCTAHFNFNWKKLKNHY